MVLDIEIGRIEFVAMVVASLAALSARSLPGMEEWPGDPLDEDDRRYGVYGTVN